MNESDISRDEPTPQIDDARISGAISKILEHPELIGMIGSMLQSPKPSEESQPQEKQEVESVAADVTPSAKGGADMLASLAPMLTKLQGTSQSAVYRDTRRESLLCALKPYLSKERCDAIDQMLKISRISDIFKNMS